MYRTAAEVILEQKSKETQEYELLDELSMSLGDLLMRIEDFDPNAENRKLYNLHSKIEAALQVLVRRQTELEKEEEVECSLAL